MPLTNPATGELSQTDSSLCIYLSIFGVLITLTCLFQLFVYADFSLIPLVLITFYLFNITAYILFGLQKRISPEFIFISVIVSFLTWLIYTQGYVISLIVIISFLYSLVVGTLVLVYDLHKKIKHKARMLKEEEDYWKEKI